MSILTLDNYITSVKQTVRYTKVVARTAIANTPFSVFDIAGNPGAGTLAIGNTAAGLVPTSGVAGYPIITAYGASAKAYLARFKVSNTVASVISLYDRVFTAGAYSFNSAVTLTGQPSYSTRIPNLDYTGTEIWFECVTAFTGIPTIAITYTNQSSIAAKTTGAISLGVVPIVGQCYKFPLAAGDSGVSKIESVTATVATVGTFNISVLRPLDEDRIGIVNDLKSHDMLTTGLPEIPVAPALYVLVTPDSTSTGIPYVVTEVANN